MFTADRAHQIQVCTPYVTSESVGLTPLQDQLPQGATLVPIIVASDKTPVTRHMGGLEMHPILLLSATFNQMLGCKPRRMHGDAWPSYLWSTSKFILISKPSYLLAFSTHVWTQCL